MGDPRNISFENAEMWIHIHNLPPQYKSLENVEVVGNLYYRYITCDRSGLDRGKWRRYIRIFAEVRVDEPLQILGELPTAEKELIEFKYEKVVDYCLFCGRMGHLESKCKERETEINGGGSGELPRIYEYSIRASSAPRNLHLGGGETPRAATLPRGALARLGFRGESDPTGFSPIGSSPTDTSTGGSEFHQNIMRELMTPTTNLDTEEDDTASRAAAAIGSGLVPRRFDEEWEEEADINPTHGRGMGWVMGRADVSPIIPPGFEQRALSLGLNRDGAALSLGLQTGSEATLTHLGQSQFSNRPNPRAISQQHHQFFPSPDDDQTSKKRKTGSLNLAGTEDYSKFVLGSHSRRPQLVGRGGRSKGVRRGIANQHEEDDRDESEQAGIRNGERGGEVTTLRSPNDP
ncbi:hypothetical protein LINGRAHAP2_LOCUS36383 [Linum grandiflorum]